LKERYRKEKSRRVVGKNRWGPSKRNCIISPAEKNGKQKVSVSSSK